jgi:hypothetical protein
LFSNVRKKIFTFAALEVDAATLAIKNLSFAVFNLATKEGRMDDIPGKLLNTHRNLSSTNSRSWLLQRVITNVVYISNFQDMGL